MNLEDIQKSYGVIVSLGGLCQVTNQIKRHNLRTFSGPLDWFYYPSLSDVNRLLQNRFKKFMKLENMVIEGSESYGLIESEFDNQIKWAERITYCIKDTYYNCFSMHDFPINSEKDLKSTYPSFKAKLDTRINRFFEKINSSESILFIRIWEIEMKRLNYKTYYLKLQIRILISLLLISRRVYLILLNKIGEYRGFVQLNSHVIRIDGKVMIPIGMLF